MQPCLTSSAMPTLICSESALLAYLTLSLVDVLLTAAPK